MIGAGLVAIATGLGLVAPALVAVGAFRPTPRTIAGSPAATGQQPGQRVGLAVVPTRHLKRLLRVGGAICIVVAVMVFGPWVVLLGGAVGGVGRVRASRRKRLVRSQVDLAIAGELAMLADLVAVGLRGGNSLLRIVERLGARLDNRIGSALADAELQHRRGLPLVEAIDKSLERIGPAGARLAARLASQDSGVAVADDLFGWAAEVRMARRHQIEAAARRLPVRMLAPLLLCVLPAFLLFTVVPLVIDGLTTVLNA